MKFYSIEIFLHDVNCHKRHHSGSTLLHLVSTLVYLLIKVSDTDSVTKLIYFLLSKMILQSYLVLVTKSQTTALFA